MTKLKLLGKENCDCDSESLFLFSATLILPGETRLTGLGPLTGASKLTLKQRIRACEILSLITGCEVRTLTYLISLSSLVTRYVLVFSYWAFHPKL